MNEFSCHVTPIFLCVFTSPIKNHAVILKIMYGRIIIYEFVCSELKFDVADKKV